MLNRNATYIKKANKLFTIKYYTKMIYTKLSHFLL